MAAANGFCMRITALLLLGILIFPSCHSARSSSDRDCNQIGNILRNKTFTYPWWDHSFAMASGSSSGCPVRGRAPKCCPASFDTPVHRREVTAALSQKWIGSKLIAAREVFSERKNRFDVTFKALLVRAHTAFHAMFERTYGMLYIQHADVFQALFKTLEKYYDDGKDHLDTKLNEFFTILTRKMFEVLNAQYDFTDAYLSCATIVISEKQGNDLHRQIVSSLRRSFVATRAFAQGLIEADRVISNVHKIPLNTQDCLIPVAQMVTCPICVENRAYKPCLPFCTANTVKCLSSTFHLIKPWNEFAKALEDLTDRLMGPYNVEAVVEPIHIKISEAIMNFQESGADLSQAVFSKCGKPTLKSRSFNKRNVLAEPRVEASIGRRGQDKDDLQPSKSLEKLLRDTKNRVKKSKDLWNVLPKQVCNAISKDYSSQQCWNGTVSIKLGKRKGNSTLDEDDGGAMPLDMQPQGRPIPLIGEQILILQLITDKLKTAYNGGDVQWVREIADNDDEFGSGMEKGSGSGEIPTDLEDTDDDDPSGEVHKVLVPTSTDLNTNTRKMVPAGGGTDKPIQPYPAYEEPTRPASSAPPHFNRPIVPDDEDEDEEEEEDEDEENSNLNINSSSNNKRPGIPIPDKDDFGVDFPPIPQTPVRTVPPPVVFIPSSTSTSTTTRKPPIAFKPRTDPPSRPQPPAKPEIPGAKTVAVVNVFTPVIFSMIQKLFNAG